MAKRILVCDVDGVVVDLSKDWFNFLQRRIPHVHLDYEEVAKSYTFHDAVSNYLTEDEAFYFWKSETLYDDKIPLPGAAECLWSLKTRFNFDIVFASHVEGHHAKSKFEFLKRHFPVDGFMATREKHFVRADVAIDDRLDHLVNHPINVVKILKHTPHQQTLTQKVDLDCVLVNWDTGTAEAISRMVERKL